MATLILVSLVDPCPLSIPAAFWGRARWLARRLGWQPQGTLPPTGAAGEGWLGSYDRAAGQTVTASDARKLAAALRRAREGDLPGEEALLAERLCALCERGGFLVLEPPAEA